MPRDIALKLNQVLEDRIKIENAIVVRLNLTVEPSQGQAGPARKEDLQHDGRALSGEGGVWMKLRQTEVGVSAKMPEKGMDDSLRTA